MNPPAPGPVSGYSVTNDISTDATAASTALPPARSTSAPACAVSGCPAATTPLMRRRLAGRSSQQKVGGEAAAETWCLLPSYIDNKRHHVLAIRPVHPLSTAV